MNRPSGGRGPRYRGPIDLTGRVLAGARTVLEEAWVDEDGCCRPNPDVYPHQWLWDSCFHAIAWASLGDRRGLRELASAFRAQLPDGMVPHMRYLGDPGASRGPCPASSSFTQPPVFAHAAMCLHRRGFPVPPDLVAAMAEGLRYLYERRRTPEGLVFITHPWESGADDSPRWDGWIDGEVEPGVGWRHDTDLVAAAAFCAAGSAMWSRRFVAVPAGFNALTAHAFLEFGALTGDGTWITRGRALAAAIDEHLWNAREELWDDLAVVAGGPSVSVPTLDGALPALVTDDGSRARRVLGQLRDPARFAAPFGLTYTARRHPTFDPTGYWRGAAWPHLNYLCWLVARRWDDGPLATEIVRQSREAALLSGFAEYWNPLTGAGLGAAPQTWAAIAAAYGE